MGKDYAIAAGHRLTAEAGAEVLAAGGTAVDAAVAAAMMAMVAEPVLAGLLGGGFLMLRPASGPPALLDAFVDTPGRPRPEGEADLREIHADFGDATQAFTIGAGTVAVPCLAQGLWQAHERHGRMAFPDLAAPAVRAAREGVGLTAFQAKLARIIAPILTASPGALALHADGDELRGEGARIANPDLADVLEEYAAEGPRFVAEGEVAARLLRLTEDGGHLSRDDLARAAPVWRRPLTAIRSGVRIALNPAPSLGGAMVAAALAITPKTPEAVDLARVFAALARGRAAADLVHDPEGGVARLLSEPFLARLSQELDGRPVATRGTTHISAVDREGAGAALTLSNGEGCGLVIPGTGIMPNNMLGEADLLPDGPLSWRPRVRLASMMAPMAMDWPDGRVAMLGSGGSNRIRSALAQVAMLLADRGTGLEDAITAARLHVEGVREAEVDFEERGLPEAERAALLAAFPEARGWPEPSMFFGGAHAVRRDPRGGTEAAGDPRRDGVALTG